MGQEQSPFAAQPAERQGSSPDFVVGIGASAGGLESLERFFEEMPSETGMAFVVLQHLSPDFKSLTDELLARRTKIPIFQARDGMPLTADAIFLLPPRKNMILSNGKLLLTDKDLGQVSLPIDHFFRALAQDAGDRAIGIVLSGTGSDGSRGIRDIHEAGGLVLAQSEASAKFDGMPKSAIKTGAVDLVLPPGNMPDALLKYIKHPSYREKIQPPTDPDPQGMQAIFRLLHEAHGIDFSHYKPNTVIRRTERRLLLNRIVDLEEYVRRLAADPGELNALYRDLLVGVTRIFRDQEAFAILENTVLPEMLRQHPQGEEFRGWVAGCATGEEAYSLAILVQECSDKLGRNLPIKIFATDVHRTSLDQAGSGYFREESLVELQPERLQRWFVRRGEGYQVTPELRRLVVFAQHDVIKDAPFTKLDLIACRNLLIYFQPAVQKKVLSLFHFGLKTGGCLFLGSSESPGEIAEEFEVLDGRWKLYRKRRDVRLTSEVRVPAGLGIGLMRAPHVGPQIGGVDQQILGTYDGLLEAVMPPSLLVDENRRIVQSFGGASKYLHLKDGRFTADLLDMVEGDLRMALSGAVQRSLREKGALTYRGLRVATSEGEQLVDVKVRPVVNKRTQGHFALIAFEEASEKERPKEDGARQIDLPTASNERLLSLETELTYTKENLQAAIEELETSNEELQATNEELLAANEELQSTNEELHSVNEELYTVNAEHQKKIGELTELTADMDNLLASTEVHVLFLDRNGCIRKFTPKIAETFNLLPQDIGRRIEGFTYNLDCENLLEQIAQVLESGKTAESQVRDRKGKWFLLRVLPYRTGGTVDGVVLTLIEIDEMKRLEQRALEKTEQLAGILRHSPHMVFMKDRQGRYVLTDDSFRRQLTADPTGKTPQEIYPGPAGAELAAMDRLVLQEGKSLEQEVEIGLPQGAKTFLVVKFPLHDDRGNVVGVGGIQTDVTRMKEAERHATEAVQQRDTFLAMLSHELRNPLAAILNAVEILDGRDGAGAVRDWHRLIERRARHMARLLDDLLDVARLTRNKIEIRKQLVDLRHVLESAVEEVRPAIERRHQRLQNLLPNEPLLVEGDPDRLLQIQANLLLNASKYTPEGGEIHLQAQGQDGEAILKVKDTGMGIAPEMLDKVFEPFVQGDRSLDRSQGGLGVGLTLVRSLVELHGGRVETRSAGPGRGSEFTVRLPSVRRQEAVSDNRAPAGTGSAPPRNWRILVVEDDADIRESLQALLELDGHEVRTASDAGAALDALETELAEGIFVDIGLPEIDGYELARRIRRRFGLAGYLLVALTGYGRSTDSEAARAAGFDAHLTKPLRPRDLYEVLERLWRDQVPPGT